MRSCGGLTPNGNLSFQRQVWQQRQALGHANYISREAEYQHRGGLEHIEHGNMPTWAQEDLANFWQAADTFERANGSGYREFEIALPRELTSAQRIELVRDFICEELGDKHAYSVALHNSVGSIDSRSHKTRGIERTPEYHFGFKAAGRMTSEQKLAIRDLRALSNSNTRYCELKKSDFSQTLVKDYYQSAAHAFKAEYGQGAEMLKTFKLDLIKSFQQEHNKKLHFNYPSGKAEVKPLQSERRFSRGWSL